jgi:hypothetical protein
MCHDLQICYLEVQLEKLFKTMQSKKKIISSNSEWSNQIIFSDDIAKLYGPGQSYTPTII